MKKRVGRFRSFPDVPKTIFISATQGLNLDLLKEAIAQAHFLIKKIKVAAMERLYTLPKIWADMRNTSNKKVGGSITAALFLKQFVENFP